MSAREAHDAIIEQWHRAQETLAGINLTTLEHVGIGLVIMVILIVLVAHLVNRQTPGVPGVVAPPQPKKENTGMAPKAVTMSKKQKMLLVRALETGFYQIRLEDQQKIKNKVKGHKPLTDTQAKSIYRACGYAFDIPCIMPVTTKVKFKAKIRGQLAQLKKEAVKIIPGPKPKPTVEPNNLPTVGGAKGKTPAMSF
jgi:hypothetical protein